MNSNELIINGKDAWTNYRVKMGSGFLDALEADADNKSYIANEVRTEHGTRVVPIRPKKAAESALVKRFEDMTTSIKNKMRKVMQLAHRAYQLKSSSMSWVECLKQAWQVVKLEAAMKTKVVEFFFMKMNGEVRQAFGTLLQSHIDYTPNGTGHAASRDCIRYWDEEKGAWRQFKAYNFLRVA